MNYDPYTVHNHQRSQGFVHYSSYEDFYKFFEVNPQNLTKESELGVFPHPLSQKTVKGKTPTKNSTVQSKLKPAGVVI